MNTDKIKMLPLQEQNNMANHHMRDISIWLDNYDDVFSDFDPRAFSERNISDDFLYELKKVSRETDFHVNELKLLVPEKIRIPEDENVIAKRLHTHFRKTHHVLSVQQKLRRKKGWLFTLSGLSMMIVASYISTIKSDTLGLHALFVMLEPAGWFLAWTGLENLLNISKAQKPELDFYTKFLKSKVVFSSI